MASMRPQLIAADNVPFVLLPTSTGDDASMRPQLIAADNGVHPPIVPVLGGASMRPQLIAADN